ncbi:hypothetical protein, partial [Streptomyces palmae]
MPTNYPWFESLTDSVFALGAAAREAQAAYRAAVLSCDAMDLDRLRPVDGEIAIPGRAPSSVPVRPHDHVLYRIQDIHRTHRDELETLYSRAAQEYAYGTAWAIVRVLDGHQPTAVELKRTRDGFTIPTELAPV